MKLVLFTLLAAMVAIARGQTLTKKLSSKDHIGYFGPRRCMVGVRSFYPDGRVASDTAFPSLCRGTQSYCITHTYTITSEDEKTGDRIDFATQYGYCSSNPAEADCELFKAGVNPAFGNISNCFSNFCGDSTFDSVCNPFTGFNGGFYEGNDKCASSELQLFPACNVQETIEGFFKCANILFNGYPFNNEDRCRTAWDETAECMAELSVLCLSSSCPTLLDNFEGVRSEYTNFLVQAVFVDDLKSLSEMIQLNFGVGFEPFLSQFGCGDSSELQNQILGQLEEMLGNLELETLLQSVGVPVNFCPGLISSMQRAVLEFVPQIVRAEGPGDVERAFGDLQRNVMGAFSGCDTFGILGGISGLLGSFDISLPVNAITNVVQMFTNFFPGTGPGPDRPGPGPGPVRPGECPRMDSNMMEMNCQRYHGDQSRCGQRRSWFCDYQNWRMNFLRSWLREFRSFMNNREDFEVNIPLPPRCVNETGLVRCASSQLCCYEVQYSWGNNCLVCHCAEHDYVDSEYLEEQWSRDSMMWTRYFNRYQQVMREEQEKNNDNKDDDDNDDECPVWRPNNN